VSLLVDSPAEGVTRITFNRPEVRNAFTFEMFRELLALLRGIQYDAGTRVVVLTGAGMGFCSGIDVSTPTIPEWVPTDVGTVHRDLYAMQEIREIPILMRGMPQPVIAAVNGSVAGFGAVFALAADVAIAGGSAKFVNAFHYSAIGSEGGVSYLLPRAVGTQRAAELLLTTRTIGADEAARIGLVLETVPDDALEAATLALAASMMGNTPLDNWLTKQALYANLDAPSYAHAVDYDTRGVVIARTTADMHERRAAVTEQRPPHFRHA
jgi:enoyl-CoA hydratase